MKYSILRDIAIFSLLATASGHAQSPSTGLLYNTSETHSMSYECRTNSSELECSFVQTAVRRKAQSTDLANVLEKAKAQFPEFIKSLSKNECGSIEKIHDALQRGAVPEGVDPRIFSARQAAMTAIEKSDMMKNVSAFVALCRAPSEAAYLSFIRLSHEKDVRTCSVSAHTFKQRFKRVDRSENWAVIDSPNGPCGVVNVSRFEKEMTSGIAFWNYFSRKVVTNKRGEFLPGASCAGLDEQEYTYSWRSREIQLGCDYVTFGVL